VARGKRKQSPRKPALVGDWRRTRRQLEADRERAENELRLVIADLPPPRRFDPDWIEDGIRNVALTVAEGADDDLLERINEFVLGLEFDERPVDPEWLAEDPHGAFMTQLMVGYADHLEEHLRGEFAAHPSAFLPDEPDVHFDTRRERPSGLAAND
jgi:hypothetical protein